jgi:cleavage and polyadenylation specificity factor subunit 3
VTPLGAGSEVGRSCVLLAYKGKTVMLDCGIHPGLSGMASLPYFDDVDLSTVDVLLVTHFHLDHCAAVPFLLAHTTFRGRVFMTHATKAIYHMLLQDFVKLNRGGAEEALFSEADLQASMEKIELVDFQQELDVGGIRVTPYRAGHVLGAAMFMVDIAGLRVLYTGDYSRKADRHLPGADTPEVSPHVLIVESTYGVATHSPKEEREKRFTDKVAATVLRGGKLLLPIVALGRAQELLLILEDYWARHPDLRRVPIYQASGLARRSLSIYQTYINMLNEDVQAAFDTANPFQLKHIRNLTQGGRELEGSGACVVLATPSMLQTGLSRELFEAWCGDARNCVIIADFAVAGTLARDILQDAKSVTGRSGAQLPIACAVEAISFSAHADFPQTSSFVSCLAPQHVVLVHGEAVEMQRLKRALEAQAQTEGREPFHVYTPKNCQPVAIQHRGEKVLRVAGRLAAAAAEGRPLSGVLLRKEFGHLLLHPADLGAFSTLRAGSLRQRQLVPCAAPFASVRLAMEALFEGIAGIRSAVSLAPPSDAAEPSAAVKLEEGASPASPPREEGLVIDGRVCISPGTAPGAAHVVFEWVSDTVSDMVADAALALVLTLVGPPPSLSAAEEALRSVEGTDGEEVARWRLFTAMLSAQFGAAELDEAAGIVSLGFEGQAAAERGEARCVVALRTGEVACEDAGRRGRVEKALERFALAVLPLKLPEMQSEDV